MPILFWPRHHAKPAIAPGLANRRAIPMACTHTKDPNWSHDLLWYYLHEKTTSAGGGIGAHYKGIDPKGELNNRHRVYELIVDEPAHTNPAGAQLDKSMIPWNQNNEEVLKQVKGALVCGDIVKYFFAKYMGGGTNEPTLQQGHHTGNAGTAAEWVVARLRSNKPVRARITHGGAGHHYVGIVGYRCAVGGANNIKDWKDCKANYEFLFIDPWAGSMDASYSMVYAGATTKFLGIMKMDAKKLKYSTGNEHVTWVEAWS